MLKNINETLQLQTLQIPKWKFWSAEFIGTFLLTFVATLPVVIGACSAEITHADKVVSPGLLVMIMIYVLGDLSGAHFNPAVTLAFAARGSFPWSEVPPYWLAQLGGAVFASLLIRTVFGDAMHLGATTPVGGTIASYWIYVAGPICGAMIATWLFTLLQGWPIDTEKTVAKGDAPHD